MKSSLLLSLFVLSLLVVSCYNQRPDIKHVTYVEPADPEPIDVEAWELTGRGLHLSYGSKDKKYKKGKVPMLSVIKDANVQAWQGECVSLQAVIWSAYDVDQVECEWGDLVSANGDTISRNIIQTHFVRYIMSDAGFVPAGDTLADDQQGCLMPDMLDQLPCMNMEARSVRPLWITLNLPDDMTAGVYRTSLKVYSKKNSPQELRLTLKVIDKKMPPVDLWSFQTNLAINPLSIARWHKVTSWSPAHFDVMDPYVALLKRAGQKTITTNIFSSLEDIKYESPLIKWTVQEKGLDADFTHFDQWVSFMMQQGISARIECNVFFNDEHCIAVFDPQVNGYVHRTISVQEDKVLLSQCLEAVISHLESKGWYDRSVFAYGSDNMKAVEGVKQVLQGIQPDVKLELLVQEWTPGLMDGVFAANVPAQYSNLKEWFKIRNQQGQASFFHLDANNRVPNIFLHSPSSEAAWLGWYAMAQGIDGLHVKDFNNWLDKPLLDARVSKQSSGGNFLIYPEGRSSIRYERLIEGIQDYEKLRMIRDQELAKGDVVAQQRLEKLDEVLSDFVINRIPRESAAQMIGNGRQVLHELALPNGDKPE
ncbi:glycoside hydrolase domain-containing protein [Carboxylicivirga sp. 1411-1]